MVSPEKLDLFVPGRICLFGEHSDWAGGYRTQNPDLVPGATIITGTDQGISAKISPDKNILSISSTDSDGIITGPRNIPVNPQSLLDEARNSGFFSYIAGVAYEIQKNYQVGGLNIDNYLTNLPVKKGLSSSAAICVLTARAFNRVYNLNLTTRQEMEYAYRGEILTGSMCGRMDQGCAYGNKPILMVFDGDKLDIRELMVGTDFYLVLVDLIAGKDTRIILKDLNSCFPFAKDPKSENLQNLLGKTNQRITGEAVDALKSGNPEKLGNLMTEAQKLFDDIAGPVCPSQLTAPVLHRILTESSLQPLIWGGKGVGSQGDGTAQFLVKSPDDQTRVARIVKDKFGMHSYPLTIKTTG
jgi:galactokinase